MESLRSTWLPRSSACISKPVILEWRAAVLGRLPDPEAGHGFQPPACCFRVLVGLQDYLGAGGMTGCCGIKENDYGTAAGRGQPVAQAHAARLPCPDDRRQGPLHGAR